MHRIDGPGNEAGFFTEGNPFAVPTPIEPTVVTAAWLNDLQEQVAQLVLASGQALTKGDHFQLAVAIQLLVPALATPTMGRTISFTAGQAFAQGDGFLLVDTFGVIASAVGIGQSATLQVIGQFTLPKITTDVVNVGQRLYWNVAQSKLTVTAGSNRLVGVARAAAGNGTTTVSTRIPAPSSAIT